MKRLTRSQVKASSGPPPATENEIVEEPVKKVFRPVPIRPPEDTFKLATFEAIPTSTMKIIQQYLNATDYRQLLNTNAAIFQHIKYETVYYNFIGYERWKRKIKGFNDPDEKKDYFADLYASVKDKSKQISLRVYHPTQKIVKENGHFMPGIHQLTFIDTYNGSFWRPDVNMQLFCNIYKVIFREVHQITHLKGLENIKVLIIQRSYSLLRIDFIPGLKKLVLQELTRLREIPEYGSIGELIVSNCQRLNPHGLGNHKKVKLHSLYNPIDYSQFSGVEAVSISQTSTSGASDLAHFVNAEYVSFVGNGGVRALIPTLPNARFLRLHYTKIEWNLQLPFTLLESVEFTDCIIADLSPLQNVRTLCLFRCEGSVDLRVLLNIRKLSLDSVQGVTDVSMLGGLEELCLLSCQNITDISMLGTVKKLNILGCSKITSLTGLGKGNSEVLISSMLVEDFSPLQSVWKVTVDRCAKIVEASSLKDVKHLTLSSCYNLEDLSGLERLTSLTLIHCDKVKSLKGLGNIPRIHLERCAALEDIDDLGNQQYLFIYYCYTISQLIKADKKRGKYDALFEKIPFVRVNERGHSWHQVWRPSNYIPDPFLF